MTRSQTTMCHRNVLSVQHRDGIFQHSFSSMGSGAVLHRPVSLYKPVGFICSHYVLAFFLPTCVSTSTCPTALFSYVFVSVLRPFLSTHSSLLIRLFSRSDSGRCLILNCGDQRLIGRPVGKRKEKKKTAVSEHHAKAFFFFFGNCRTNLRERAVIQRSEKLLCLKVVFMTTYSIPACVTRTGSTN